MRRKIVVFCTIPFLWSAGLRASDLAACRPGSEPGRQDFVINAASGGLEGEGTTRYHLDDKVRILVVDKNPFTSDYRLDVEEVAIPETGLTDFLKLFAFTSQISTPEQSSAQLTPANAPLAGRRECLNEQMQTLRSLINEKNKQLGQSRIDLAKKWNAFEKTYKQRVEELQKTQEKMRTTGASCEKVREAAELFLQQADVLAQSPIAPIKETLGSLKDQASAQAALVKDFKNRLTAGCEVEGLIIWDNELAVSGSFIKELGDNIGKVEANQTAMQKQRDATEKAGSQVHAFYEQKTVGPYDDPTEVNIKLQRKSLAVEDAKFEEIGHWTLRFGGRPRFTLAAGVAFSPYEDRTYGRIQGFARNPDGSPIYENGAPKLTTVIGLKKESSSRAVPLLILHARVYEPESKRYIDGIHLSLGLTAKIEDRNTDVEYLTGVSFSFAGERLFLTLGGYYGASQRLTEGLYLGYEAPQSLAEIPTRESYHWKPGVALSLKLR
jgi:hypothetical protein